MMLDTPDVPALIYFVGAWIAYSIVIERTAHRGQRAFFIALGYLGWFLGPLPFASSTTAVLIVMWRRQFAPQSRRAFSQVSRRKSRQE